jgi:predicted DNA-binding transcriptional regulator AlpA
VPTLEQNGSSSPSSRRLPLSVSWRVAQTLYASGTVLARTGRSQEGAERRDDGFLDANGAADYLGLTRKTVYALVERDRIPYSPFRSPFALGPAARAATKGVVERSRRPD